MTKAVGNLLLALARLAIYILTGVHIGSDGKEVTHETPSYVEKD